MKFDFPLIIDSFPKIALGIGLTLQLLVLALVIGSSLGLIAALMRVSGNPALAASANGRYCIGMRRMPFLMLGTFTAGSTPSLVICKTRWTHARLGCAAKLSVPRLLPSVAGVFLWPSVLATAHG